jgi:outer membrane protein TolC
MNRFGFTQSAQKSKFGKILGEPGRLVSIALLAGLSTFGLACSQFAPARLIQESSSPPVARGVGDDDVFELPEFLKPKAQPDPYVPPRPPPAPATNDPAKMLPITLDSVMRLAEDQNAQIGIARARVNEASALQDIAARSWLPALNVGPSYYRHEGGDVFPNGVFVHSSYSTLFAGMEIDGQLDLREATYRRLNAERAEVQQQGELRKITTETLLEAAGTYLDLLAARSAEAVVASTEQELARLLERAKRLANPRTGEPGAKVEEIRVAAQLTAQRQTIVQLRDKARAASAKLSYLLGLDPCTTLVPVDEQFVALDLVSTDQAICDMVAQALANGPGVKEMERILGIIQEGNEKSKSLGRYLPVFEVRALEGGFGAGPGDSQTWDNRLDIGLQARWNLTDLFNARDRGRVLEAKTEQAQLAYQDLKAKLTVGVRETRDEILSGREAMRLGQEQITQTRQAYRLSDQRLTSHIEGSTFTEVLLSLQSLNAAQFLYLDALRSYDKAQIRLLLLLGKAAPHPAVKSNCPAPIIKAE